MDIGNMEKIIDSNKIQDIAKINVDFASKMVALSTEFMKTEVEKTVSAAEEIMKSRDPNTAMTVAQKVTSESVGRMSSNIAKTLNAAGDYTSAITKSF